MKATKLYLCEDILRWPKFFLGLPCQQEKLLPRPEGGNPDLLQLLVSEGGEGGQIDLVTHKDVRVPGFPLINTVQVKGQLLVQTKRKREHNHHLKMDLYSTHLESPWLARSTGKPSPMYFSLLFSRPSLPINVIMLIVFEICYLPAIMESPRVLMDVPNQSLLEATCRCS